MTNLEHQTIQEKINEAIKNGQVKMRPKWQFVLQTTLFIVAITGLFFAVLYLGSFIIFTSHRNGAWFALGFGAEGIGEFIRSLPLLFVLTVLIFIGLLEILVRRYSVAYSKPMLYSVLAIVGVVFVGTALITYFQVHEGLFNQARMNRLPFGNNVYGSFTQGKMSKITPGRILQFTPDGFVMKDFLGDDFVVIISPNTMLPDGDDFNEKETVVVFGPISGRTIKAKGIRDIDVHEGLFDPIEMPRPQMMK